VTDVVALHGGQTQNVSVQVCAWSWFPRGRLRATRAAPREHRQPSRQQLPKSKGKMMKSEDASPEKAEPTEGQPLWLSGGHGLWR
jgi:hypothetical protein